MNRLDRSENPEGRLDRAWQKLTLQGKGEFEEKYGRWDILSDEQRFSSLSSYFSELRQQTEDDRIRKITEPYVRAMESFAQLLDKRFGQMEGQLEKMSRTGEELRGHVRELETKVNEPKQIQDRSMVGTPTGIQPQVNVYASYPLKMDCRYREKGGPKECIVIETTPEGRYGTCTVGDQVRRMQILPRLFTTAFEKAGCPSNRLIRPCEYYLTKRVPIS
ncbi:hypothetical protein HYX05_01140 [Candidatus Woesearchaeota archaeon]|nr:hypothetical protein [Candidatus Woesearchaeota archaeon]